MFNPLPCDSTVNWSGTPVPGTSTLGAGNSRFRSRNANEPASANTPAPRASSKVFAGCLGAARPVSDSAPIVEYSWRGLSAGSNENFSTQGSLASGVAALHLRPAPPLFEVAGRLFLGLVADLDVVHHALGAGRFRHSRSRAFVLHHAGGALPIRDAALHADGESILAYLRFRQLDANRALDRFVFLGGSPLRVGGFGWRSFCL